MKTLANSTLPGGTTTSDPSIFVPVMKQVASKVRELFVGAHQELITDWIRKQTFRFIQARCIFFEMGCNNHPCCHKCKILVGPG
jgi:hypothetical protein